MATDHRAFGTANLLTTNHLGSMTGSFALTGSHRMHQGMGSKGSGLMQVTFYTIVRTLLIIVLWCFKYTVCRRKGVGKLVVDATKAYYGEKYNTIKVIISTMGTT